MMLKGFFIIAGKNVDGWVRDAKNPNHAFEVFLEYQSQPLGQVRADVYRPDLEQLGMEDGRYGFVFHTETPLPADARLKVYVNHPDEGIFELKQITQSKPDFLNTQYDGAYKPLSDPFDQKPLFILGPARSGTSAITHAINSCTSYKGPGEGHFFELLEKIYGQVEQFYQRDKYDEWAQERNTLIRQIPKNLMRDAIGDAIRAITNQVFAKPTWMDKTPNDVTIRIAPELLKIYPNARFIFMKRRGIENIMSRMSKFPQFSFREHCLAWTAAMQTWLNIRDRVEGFYLEIDQYDMLKNPSTVFSNVSKFLNLSDDEAEKMHKVLLADNVQIQRTSADIFAAATLDSVGWTDEQRQCFIECCQPVMNSFGYSLDEKYFV